MKRMLILAVPMLLSILLTGCPFDSETPIGDPVAGSIDPRLLGTWYWTESSSVSATEFRVFRFSSAEYYLETQEEGKEVERARMYIVTIGGQKFLNANELTDDESMLSYTLARYSISDDGLLAIRFVGDKAVPEALATNRQGLIDFLASHLDGTALDDPDGPFILSRSKPEVKLRTGDAK
jgi:hypothetical protein